MFQHYIITRFNLRRDDWKTTKNDDLVLSDSWLEERFELFEDFCFPSVKNQSNQNFKWLVFFDVNTPEKYKIKIEEFKTLFGNFKPFFIDGMDAFLPSINEKVRELDQEQYIISSRLDNDDSIHKDYVSVVQSCFDNQNFLAVDIVDGYGMQTGSQVYLGKMKHLYNPYISLIEKKESCKTVWHKGHTFWKYENRILRVKNKRMWLTVIHEKNKSNKFRGYGNVKPEVLHEFNISKSKLDELKNHFQKYKLFSGQNIKNCFHNLLAYYSKIIKKSIGLYKIKVRFDKNDFD